MSNDWWFSENIKECVLTDVLNWKTIEKSYEDVCELCGKTAMSKYCHQFLFTEFTEEVRILEKAETNINEIIFNKSIYPKYLIFHVISKVPIDISYICLGEMGFMSYPEFEFWYYRFYNGQRDLDYDRSKDPKPLTFSDLPVDVVEKIVEKLDVKSRYNLRPVSRGLKALVDSSLLKVEKITVAVFGAFTATCVNDVKKDIRHGVSDYLLTFIRNPKLQLGILDINLSRHLAARDIMPVGELFKSLNHQIHVRNLRIKISTKQDLMDLMRYLKPKLLKKIDIDCDFIGAQSIHGIIESEQWKQAEEIIISNPTSCHIVHFFHFKSFDICLSTVSMESMIHLRDGISESSNFEWCRLRAQRRRSLMKHDWPTDEKTQKVLGLKKHVHNSMTYFVYTISNSTEMLVFSFFDREIFIKKSNLSSAF